MNSKITLLDVVLDYIIRYGLTDVARQHFIGEPGPMWQPSPSQAVLVDPRPLAEPPGAVLPPHEGSA